MVLLRNISKMKLLILFLLLILFSNILGQCPSGSIGVTGPGCGCLANCNLTSLGGPNCGTGTSGDCTGGYLPMSTDIIVPEGCDYTVSATMRPRVGCSASGADGNCNNCDRLKVDIIGGIKPWKIGGSNSILNDSYTLTGPGTIRISGAANRADEIITYTTTSSLCPDCSIILPISLIDFNVKKQEDNIEISWSTLSQTYNNFFVIERMGNDKWEDISYINSNNGNQFYKYQIWDYDAPKTQLYYRLKQVDYDGSYSYSKIVSVDNKEKNKEIIKIVDLLGNEIDENTQGIKIIIYSDGTTQKYF